MIKIIPPLYFGNTPDSSSEEVGARRVARGLAVTFQAQALKFFVSLGFTAVLARLLTPSDYGLVAMVTVLTGLLGIFRDGGLTAVTVQREMITHEQVSTLFWINSGIGTMLALVVGLLSPVVAWLYNDPSLIPITIALSLPFIFGGLAAQLTALLQREMRFTALAVSDLCGLLISGFIGIAAAALGFGTWALVIMTISYAAINATFVFSLCKWRPGRPRRRSGVRSMLRFGGALTVNRLFDGLASSLDVLLLGKLFSPASVGFYTRSQTLMLQPLNQIMPPIQSVALPFLSRLTSNPERLNRTFFSLFLVIAVMSSYFTSTLFVGADWIVRIFLGPGWSRAAEILRLMSGAAFVLPLCSMCVLLLTAEGRGGAIIRWSVVKSIIVIASVLGGITWGAEGVAAGLTIGSVGFLLPILSYLTSSNGAARFRDIGAAGLTSGATCVVSVFGMMVARDHFQLDDPFIGLTLLAFVNLALHSVIVGVLPPYRKAFFDGFRTLKLSFSPIRKSI